MAKFGYHDHLTKERIVCMSKIEVKVVRMGANNDEATLTRWIKKEGDQVNEGDPIAEMETDKVNYELEAPASGILTEILVGDDQVVKFGAVIAYIESA